MADFRLRQDAEKWFSEIQNREPIKSKYDLYYFCLVLGLVTGRQSDPVADKRAAPEFIGYFIDDYKASQRMIMGLLIIAELKRRGIDSGEKATVRKVIQSIVTPQSQTNLTDEGMRLMNGYASGGYDYLTENRDSKPFTVDQFLRDYVGLVRGSLEEQGFGNS